MYLPIGTAQVNLIILSSFRHIKKGSKSTRHHTNKIVTIQGSHYSSLVSSFLHLMELGTSIPCQAIDKPKRIWSHRSTWTKENVPKFKRNTSTNSLLIYQLRTKSLEESKISIPEEEIPCFHPKHNIRNNNNRSFLILLCSLINKMRFSSQTIQAHYPRHQHILQSRGRWARQGNSLSRKNKKEINRRVRDLKSGKIQHIKYLPHIGYRKRKNELKNPK